MNDAINKNWYGLTQGKLYSPRDPVNSWLYHSNDGKFVYQNHKILERESILLFFGATEDKQLNNTWVYLFLVGEQKRVVVMQKDVPPHTFLKQI